MTLCTHCNAAGLTNNQSPPRSLANARSHARLPRSRPATRCARTGRRACWLRQQAGHGGRLRCSARAGGSGSRKRPSPLRSSLRPLAVASCFAPSPIARSRSAARTCMPRVTPRGMSFCPAALSIPLNIIKIMRKQVAGSPAAPGAPLAPLSEQRSQSAKFPACCPAPHNRYYVKFPPRSIINFAGR